MMASISRTAANKHAIFLNIDSTTEINIDALARNFEAKFFPNGAPPDCDIRVLVKALVSKMGGNFDDFESLDRLVARERSDDSIQRVQRDDIVLDLRQIIIYIRDFVRLMWGDRAVQRVGLNSDTPESPNPLLLFARNVHEKLGEGLSEFPLRNPRVEPPDLSELAAELMEQIEALETSLNAVNRDIRETQDAQNERNRAADTWSREYSPIASIVENLFRLADMREHADRVRPTSRRRAGLVEEEDVEYLDDDFIESDDVVEDVEQDEEPASI